MMQYVEKKLTWRVSYLFMWLVDFLIFFFYYYYFIFNFYNEKDL